jgi:hypothetical protein
MIATWVQVRSTSDSRWLQHGGREGQPLLHTERVRFELVLRAPAQADQLEQSFDLRRVTSLHVRYDPQVVTTGEIRVEIRRFKSRTDAAPGCMKVGRASPAEQLEATASGCDNAQQKPDRGRLACPVRTEEAEHLSGLDAKRNVIDRGRLAIPLAEAEGLDDRWARDIGHGQ